MTQLWREFYYRISLGGGLLALLLIKAGFATDISRWTEEFLKPKELFPSPVVMSCEEKQYAHPPFKFEKPSWCQASRSPGELDHEKIKNILKTEESSRSKEVTL